MITLDLLGMSRDELLMAIRELDREAGARLKCYPKLVVDGKLTADVVETRRLALAAAREVCACVSRGMISECGTAVRVLPVLPAVPADGGTDDGEEGDAE
jgi:hypothetical protein